MTLVFRHDIYDYSSPAKQRSRRRQSLYGPKTVPGYTLDLDLPEKWLTWFCVILSKTRVVRQILRSQ